MIHLFSPSIIFFSCFVFVIEKIDFYRKITMIFQRIREKFIQLRTRYRNWKESRRLKKQQEKESLRLKKEREQKWKNTLRTREAQYCHCKGQYCTCTQSDRDFRKSARIESPKSWLTRQREKFAEWKAVNDEMSSRLIQQQNYNNSRGEVSWRPYYHTTDYYNPNAYRHYAGTPYYNHMERVLGRGNPND